MFSSLFNDLFKNIAFGDQQTEVGIVIIPTSGMVILTGKNFIFAHQKHNALKKTTLTIVFAFIALSIFAQDTNLRSVVLFSPGDYNSQYYRIPAVITARDGSIVTATDKRKSSNNDLPEDIDIVIRRSTDNGRTWEEPVTMAQGTGKGKGFGDCALAWTNSKKGLIAAFVGGTGLWQSTPDNPNHSYIAISQNNGKSWSKPIDITHFIFGANCPIDSQRTWRASFFGSGNGLLTSKGRIIFAAAIRETEDWTLCNHAVYSDDNGKTWHVSKRASIGGDEAKIVELEDGRLLMSIRHNGERWFNISDDGGVSWMSTTGSWKDMIAPACNGDLIRYDSKDERFPNGILLHSVPIGTERKNVSVLASFDQGKTWPIYKTIVPYSSAYSSLCVLPDSTIGLYVEESTNNDDHYTMVFYNFSMEWLLNGGQKKQ